MLHLEPVAHANHVFLPHGLAKTKVRVPKRRLSAEDHALGEVVPADDLVPRGELGESRYETLVIAMHAIPALALMLAWALLAWGMRQGGREPAAEVVTKLAIPGGAA